MAVTAFTVAVLEYCTLLLAVTVIGSDTYVIYDPIFTVHIHTYNKRHTSVKSYMTLLRSMGMDNVILNIYDLLPESRSRQQPQSSSSSSSQPPAAISNLISGLLAPMGFGT